MRRGSRPDSSKRVAPEALTDRLKVDSTRIVICVANISDLSRSASHSGGVHAFGGVSSWVNNSGTGTNRTLGQVLDSRQRNRGLAILFG